MVQAPRPNAGRAAIDIPSSYAKMLGETKFQLQEFRQSGLKARHIKKKQREKKVSENNGKLRLPPQVEQARRQDQNFSFGSFPKVGEKQDIEREKKVSENNGQLPFRPPPHVEHASRLDQNIITLPVTTE